MTEDRLDTIKIVLLSAVLSGFSFWRQGNVGIDLVDEGYLWYGAIHTALGRVPIRDFHSYDPGRYYWAALWSFVFGRGIMGLRASLAVFQWMSLAAGLLAAKRVVKSWWALALVGVLLISWMHPYYKHFESGLAMMAVFFAVRLMERPVLSRYFSSGIFVGIAAFFGRNMGVYSLFAFLLLIFYVWLKFERTGLIKRWGVFVCGIGVGYSPVLVMILIIPGFFSSFFESVVFTLRLGAMTIPLPVPWPWSVGFSSLKRFFTGLLFLLMPLGYIAATAGLFLTGRRGRLAGREHAGRRALLTASAFVGLFYMHYAFSSADRGHLSLSIQPFLLMLVSLPYSIGLNRKKALSYVVFAFLFLITVATASPQGRFFGSKKGYVKYDIIGDALWIKEKDARLIAGVKNAVERRVGKDEGILVAPYFPAFYCILGRESPLREIYFLFPAEEKRQVEMIKTLEEKNVNWVIFRDLTPAAMEGLRFKNTNRLLWRYFESSFEPAGDADIPEGFFLLHRKETPALPTGGGA
ncbi:MAG: hypothetical protein HY890_01825 [Deltaproteobacteria bacterium]|nr:hypothetical protein [Deltaproteobacteria bacterium]